jgi:hypothetical protein
MKTAIRSSGSDRAGTTAGQKERTVKPRAETDYRRRHRRSAQRSLGAAEGVLVALRHCSLDEAFIDIVHTAKQHNVAPIGLADALVAIAENDVTPDLDDVVVAAVGQAWGTLLDKPSDDPEGQQAQQLPMAVCTSCESPELMGRQR